MDGHLTNWMISISWVSLLVYTWEASWPLSSSLFSLLITIQFTPCVFQVRGVRGWTRAVKAAVSRLGLRGRDWRPQSREGLRRWWSQGVEVSVWWLVYNLCNKLITPPWDNQQLCEHWEVIGSGGRPEQTQEIRGESHCHYMRRGEILENGNISMNIHEKSPLVLDHTLS